MKFAIKGIDPKIARKKRQKMLKKPAGFGFFSSSAKGPKKTARSFKTKIDPAAANKKRLKEERAAMNRNILLMQAKEDKKQKKLQELHAQAQSDIPDIFDYDAYKKKMPMRRTGMNFREYGFQDMSKEGTKTKKESKYVAQIMQVAAVKQKEQDIIWEKRKLRELKKEEGDYGDVEKFVTTGYEQKLREDKKWIEEDERRARREDNVTAHEDITGSFYRNLYNGGFAGGKAKEKSVKRKRDPQARIQDRKNRCPEPGGKQLKDRRQKTEDRQQREDAEVLNRQLESSARRSPAAATGTRSPDPLQDLPATAAPPHILQDVPTSAEPPVPLQNPPATVVPPSPEREDAPLPLPSEKPVNPNDMMANALHAYLRAEHLKKQETAEGVVKKPPKPKPVKAKLDLDAIKARYLKRKDKQK